jgi:hypothetical protein
LVPKKPKEILSKIIDENGFERQFAEDSVSFLWSEVRKHLSDMTYPSITLRKLGTFVVKPWKVDQYIENYKKHLEKEALTFAEFTYRKSMEKQYKSFLKIKKELDKELVRKAEKKKTRQEYESAKTMGEQIQNNGGSPEQCDQEG